MVRPLTERFAVHLIGPRPGLAAGATMVDLADDVAAAIRHECGGPVGVMGISTGGSIAQRLAIDHADLVRRLVLASTACRLSQHGRQAQQRLADLTAAGRPRQAWAALGRPSRPEGSADGSWRPCCGWQDYSAIPTIRRT